jgi:hypothetical protein
MTGSETSCRRRQARTLFRRHGGNIQAMSHDPLPPEPTPDPGAPVPLDPVPEPVVPDTPDPVPSSPDLPPGEPGTVPVAPPVPDNPAIPGDPH